MSNPYAAVARTYPQRLFSSWQAALLITFLAFTTVTSFLHRHASDRWSFDFTQLFPAAYVIGTVAMHLKQVAIDAKGRLLPRSMPAVLVVAGACAAAYLIGLPLLMSLYGHPLLWSAALLWIWCAAICHFVIRPSLAIGAVLALAYVAFMRSSAPGNAWLASAADHSPVACLLLLASVVWFAIVTRWLLQMNAESRGYTAIASGQTGWKTRSASTEQANRPWQDPNRSWWLRFNSPSDPQMDRLVRYTASPSIFVRCRRWQVGGRMQQYLPGAMALIAALPTVALCRGGMIEPSLPPLLFGTLQMPLMFAIMMPPMQYLQHWRTRANDVLKPIRREDYLHEMGLCLAIDLARNVAVVFAVALGMNLLVRPTDLQPAAILPVLLITALAGIFCFGAIAWLLRYRSIVMLVIPTLVIVGLCILLAAGWRDPSIQSLAVCVATLLALIGLWLARDAYRRWLLTDLG